MPTGDARPRAYSYVRMSTLEQKKGDSARRQMEASARYAAKHGLDLVEGKEAYEDIGVSAFKGKHVTAGALGRFLAAIGEGKIRAGSYLLVESLDRVSRQIPYEAAPIMRQIVEAGINVVDLSDSNRLYNAQILRSESGVYTRMLARFEVAHEESKKKSERVREAWSAKRELAKSGGRKMTTWCPAWLKLSKDKTTYEVQEKRAATVRWIFNEAAEGRGVFAIARRLNQSSTPPFSKSRGWHQSYVVKILKNKAVIGLYRPTKISGRKASDDDLITHSISNYYPAIVSEELFYRVQQSLVERRNAGGRKGEHYTNLFTGIKLRCAYCGGHVRFENKGSGPKGGLYLICDDARRGLNCSAQRWRYKHFEDAFLSFVHHELDFTALRGGQQNERIAVLGRSIEALHGQIAELEAQRENRLRLVDLVQDSEAFVVPALNRLTGEINNLKSRLTELKHEAELLSSEAAALAKAPDHLKELIDTLNNSTTDLYAVRSQLAKLIKGVVSEIVIGAERKLASDSDAHPEELHVSWAGDDLERDYAAILLGQLFARTDARAFYAVRFKAGDFRIDVPPANPLDYPLDAEESKAMFYIYENGQLEIEEIDGNDNPRPVPTASGDNECPKVVKLGTVTTKVRTGTLHFGTTKL